jgi:hypothetical protein
MLPHSGIRIPISPSYADRMGTIEDILRYKASAKSLPNIDGIVPVKPGPIMKQTNSITYNDAIPIQEMEGREHDNNASVTEPVRNVVWRDSKGSWNHSKGSDN